MGNTKSANIAAHAAAGDAVASAIAKEKKRAKRCCFICLGVALACILSFIIGIVLLVYFGSSFTDNYKPVNNMSEKTAEGIAYTGIAFIILGVLLLILVAVFIVFICAMYRRFTGKGTSSTKFTPKSYAHGMAPYPQQEWGDVPNPHSGAGGHVATTVVSGPDYHIPEQPSQPLITPEVKQSPYPPANHEEIHPEVH